MSSRNRDGDGVRRALKRSTWGPVAALPSRESIVGGIGGFIAILLLASARAELNANLLIAPFGASCVLVFAIPQSPLAQPRNVIGGHLIAPAAGLFGLLRVGADTVGLRPRRRPGDQRYVANGNASSTSGRGPDRRDFRQRVLAVPFHARVGRDRLHRIAGGRFPSQRHAQALSAWRARRVGPATGPAECEMIWRPPGVETRISPQNCL